MRTLLLGISIATVIALTVWMNFPTQAKQQHDSVSIDPLAMTGTVTNRLPDDFVFPCYLGNFCIF
jgi:hypothetical protein